MRKRKESKTCPEDAILRAALTSAPARRPSTVSRTPSPDLSERKPSGQTALLTRALWRRALGSGPSPYVTQTPEGVKPTGINNQAVKLERGPRRSP